MGAAVGWEVTEWAVALAAFITALGVLWRKVIVPCRQFFRRFRAWMDRTETAIDWVETNMRPNGGSTRVDKVDQLNAHVAMLLEHDAERDNYGLRYGPEPEE